MSCHVTTGYWNCGGRIVRKACIALGACRSTQLIVTAPNQAERPREVVIPCSRTTLEKCGVCEDKVAAGIERAMSISLLHVADATAKVLKEAVVTCVGLLGTQFTMEQTFYLGRLQDHS